jgi:hypothetical protein
MQLTDEQYARLEWLARRQAHTVAEAEDAAAIAAVLAEIERLRAEATALRSEVAALGARIRRHEARARAWEYPEGKD